MSVVEPASRLWLDTGCWAEMAAEADRRAPCETGGVLLGWRTDSAVVVTHMVGPGPNASHARTSFRPDAQWQYHQIAELYEQSGRTLAYLGDWHTHPGGRLWPSRRDRRTSRRIAVDPEARCPDPVMLILASPAVAVTEAWTPGAFRCSRARRRASRPYVLELPVLYLPTR